MYFIRKREAVSSLNRVSLLCPFALHVALLLWPNHSLASPFISSVYSKIMFYQSSPFLNFQSSLSTLPRFKVESFRLNYNLPFDWFHPLAAAWSYLPLFLCSGHPLHPWTCCLNSPLHRLTSVTSHSPDPGGILDICLPRPLTERGLWHQEFDTEGGFLL